MKDKALFLEKLNGLLKMAQGQGSQITIDEVQTYFETEALTGEQMELVFEYLLAQKVAVKGYMKVETVNEKEFSEEEKAYLQEYVKDLEAFKTVSGEELQGLYEEALQGSDAAKKRLIEIYLKDVVSIAKEMHHPSVFLGDLIQEGNLGLIIGVDLITESKEAHQEILAQIRQSMQLLLEEQTELSSRDKKMVEKVQMLDESIKNLTEELGRKVSIDELAVYMGMEIEEIEDILKLTGEEMEDQEEA